MTICVVTGCNRSSHWRNEGRRGYCSVHYRRLLRSGTTDGTRADNGSLVIFLQEKALLYKGDDCLEWPYGKSNNGYGTFHIDGKKVFVHRFVCEKTHGPPSGNLDTAHSCGNRSCVNPKHLRWATRQENMADAKEHGTLHGRSNCKLSAEVIPAIRTRIDAGEKIKKIANSYGVTDGCIYDIKKGKYWQWAQRCTDDA